MKIHPLFATALLVLTACAPHAAAQNEAQDATVQPLALQVGSPTVETLDFSFRPGNIQPGTRVHLLISGFSQKIVKLNDDDSTLSSVADSTGKDLLAETPKEDDAFSFTSGPFGSFPRINDDGDLMIIELIAPQAPAPGATHISYQGELSIMLSAGTQTVNAKNIALTPGDIQLGEQSITLKSFGPSDWQEGKSSLVLTTDPAWVDTIASWKITGPDGAELSDGPNSSMTMTNSAQLDFILDASPETVNIEVVLYDDVQNQTLPLAFEMSLGVE
ncbi:MAG: hypothetical protein V3V20_12585 [Algisphaera sp.]